MTHPYEPDLAHVKRALRPSPAPRFDGTLPAPMVAAGYSYAEGRLWFAPQSGGRFEMSAAGLPVLLSVYREASA